MGVQEAIESETEPSSAVTQPQQPHPASQQAQNTKYTETAENAENAENIENTDKYSVVSKVLGDVMFSDIWRFSKRSPKNKDVIAAIETVSSHDSVQEDVDPDVDLESPSWDNFKVRLHPKP